MPKAKSPLFNEIRGSFKNMDIRTLKDGTIELSMLRIPSNPRTEAQQAQRKVYGQAVEGWRGLTEEEKAEYNERAIPLKISGWNLYMKEFEAPPEYEYEVIGYIETQADMDASDGFDYITNYQFSYDGKIIEWKTYFDLSNAVWGNVRIKVWRKTDTYKFLFIGEGELRQLSGQPQTFEESIEGVQSGDYIGFWISDMTKVLSELEGYTLWYKLGDSHEGEYAFTPISDRRGHLQAKLQITP